jgi:hypothetical protein
MGALRLFTRIVQALDREPERAAGDGLDQIAAEYQDFAYIGSRRTLRDVVLQQARLMRERLQGIEDHDLTRVQQSNADLAGRLKKLTRRLEGSDLSDPEMAAEWFGRAWEKNSGLFPDFVLAWDDRGTFGNGALLELKDSRGDSIASFNSTIPTRFKSLEDVEDIGGSSLVATAAALRDYPHSASGEHRSSQRHCFYLVRTRGGDAGNVRISLLEGSFFETLPKNALLEEVWGQIIRESEIPETQRAQMINWLGRLKQRDIAQSRTIRKASVKPRFRIMAEAHGDANVHRYPEIGPRTVNLVLKREPDYSWEWVHAQLVKEGFSRAALHPQGDSLDVIPDNGGPLVRLRPILIHHRLNGEHLVLQYQLKPT